MSVRVHGIVKFFSEDKGYGFIVPDDGSNDVFVHRSNLPAGIAMLITDQRVSFIISNSEKKDKGDGKKATDIQLDDVGRLVPPHGSGP